jgi:GT2 family glycosyltransferase
LNLPVPGSRPSVASSPSRVAVIVLNWNGREDTLECLQSVERIDYPNFEVVVVDNGSTDDSVSAIRDRFPRVTILETGANLGFAGGNNVGINYAVDQGAKYVFLLNNDTIVDHGVLRSFVDAVENQGANGILAGKIYYYADPRRLWYAGGVWVDDRSYFLHRGQDVIDDGVEFEQLSETDYACGCAMFMSTAILGQIGLLDDKFFLTYEETDLCYRARKAGYPSYVVPGAKIWHKVSTSMGGKGSVLWSYFMSRNRLLWAEKNLTLRRRATLYRRVAREMLSSYLSPHLGEKERRSSGGSVWFVEYWRALSARVKDPVRTASLRAVCDYLLRRFGDCPDSVRELGNRMGEAGI